MPILPVTYRMQAVNMACLPACIAMLLTARGETDETWDVIERLRMPYRIRAIPSEDRVVAATGFEFDEWSRRYCMREYGCELITERIAGDRMASRIEELLCSGSPVVLSAQRSSGGHAVVAYGVDSNGVYVFDPENSIRLRRPKKVGSYDWPPVECVAMNELIRRLRRGADGLCALGRLTDAVYSGGALPDIRDWVDGTCPGEGYVEGIDAIRWVIGRIGRLREWVLAESDGARVRDMFYEVGTNCLAPLVRNLFGAIVASGIVHIRDTVRGRLCCEILEALEQLFDCFMEGLNRSTHGDSIGDDVWTSMSQGLERLMRGFCGLDKEKHTD